MASKNIVAKGTTYNGVESVTFPVSGGGNATFYEVSDTTATASDVLNSKYFYTAAGVKTQGTGTAPSPTLITKNITQNGTYDAEDDDADGYSSVTVSVSGGGGDSWSWMGKNPTKVYTFTPEHVTLDNSPLASWTWSTSSSTLRAVDNYSPAIEPDMANYDYFQVYKYYCHYDYGDWSPVAALLDYTFLGVMSVIAYPDSNTSAFETNTRNYTNYRSTFAKYIAYYNSASGVKTSNASTTGLYVNSMPAPTISLPTITFRRPSLLAVGNNYRFSQTAFDNLDLSASYYDATCEIWRVDANTADQTWCEHELTDMLNNGI